MNKAKSLLEENGVTITTTHLRVDGKTFEFAKLHFVRIERVRVIGLMAFFPFKRKPIFRLVISTAPEASLITAMETNDAILIERVRRAINKVQPPSS